jgi:hypothetical protein
MLPKVFRFLFTDFYLWCFATFEQPKDIFFPEFVHIEKQCQHVLPAGFNIGAVVENDHAG